MSSKIRKTCPECGGAIVDGGGGLFCRRCLAKAFLTDAPPPETESGDPAHAIHQLGDYLLLAEIGRGGMGAVYRARQRSLNREVAVKTILAGPLASRAAIARFQAEAGAAARLRHPNIVSIHEIGEASGHHYFSMDLVHGETLAATIRRGPVPLRQATRWLGTIADAVHHAHEHGVLHRDLKPSNILIDTAGSPHVADFGLACIAEQDAELSTSSGPMGTPSYMAPEQAQGRRQDISVRTDVYALGAILYELLTRRPPFVGNSNLEILQKVTTDDPIRPSLLHPGLPPDLETICLKCLQREPSQRYSSADEVARELDRWSQGEPILARPIGGLERSVRWIRRNPFKSALAAVSVFSVLAVIAAVFIDISRRREAALSRTYNYVADVGMASGAIESGNIGQGLRLLESYRPEERGWEWYWLRGQCDPRHERLLFEAPAPLEHLTLSEDGRRLAVCTTNSVFLLDAASGAEIARWTLANTASRDRVVALSSDGTRLALAESDGIHLLRPGAASSVILPAGDCSALAFSPDGTRLAVCNSKPSLEADLPVPIDIWDVDRRIRVAGFPDEGGHAFAWRSSDRLETVGIWDQISEWSISGPGDSATPRSPTLRRIRPYIARIRQANYSMDGTWLGSVDWFGNLHLTNFNTHSQFELPDQDSKNFQFAMSADGRTLAATGGSDHGLQLIELPGGREIARWPGHLKRITGIAYLRQTDQWLTASADGTVRTWRNGPMPTAATVFTNALDNYEPRLPVFSPDSRWMAATMESGPRPEQRASQFATLALWDLARGQVITVIPGRPVAFTPDSRALVTWNREGELHRYELGTGESQRLRGPTEAPKFLEDQLSPDHTSIARLTTGHRVIIYDIRLGTVTQSSPPGIHVEWFARAPDPNLIALADGTHFYLWDLTTGATRSVLDVVAAQVTFSPDGRRVAVGDEDGAIHIVDLATGRTGPTLSSDSSVILSIAWSPDGRTLVSGSENRNLIFWNPDTGHHLIFKKRKSAACWLNFSPDGHWLVVGSMGKYELWPAPGFGLSRIHAVGRKVISKQILVQAEE